MMKSKGSYKYKKPPVKQIKKIKPKKKK